MACSHTYPIPILLFRGDSDPQCNMWFGLFHYLTPHLSIQVNGVIHGAKHALACSFTCEYPTFSSGEMRWPTEQHVFCCVQDFTFLHLTFSRGRGVIRRAVRIYMFLSFTYLQVYLSFLFRESGWSTEQQEFYMSPYLLTCTPTHFFRRKKRSMKQQSFECSFSYLQVHPTLLFKKRGDLQNSRSFTCPLTYLHVHPSFLQEEGALHGAARVLHILLLTNTPTFSLEDIWLSTEQREFCLLLYLLGPTLLFKGRGWSAEYHMFWHILQLT